MEQHEWFNMWARREFPYQELLVGDTLNWFDGPNQRLLWRTRVQKVVRLKYRTKKEILAEFPSCSDSEYFQKAANAGYFLLYRVKVIRKLDAVKPNDFRFPQLGWIRIDRDSAIDWFGLPLAKDEVAVDRDLEDFRGSLSEFLQELNEKMKGVSPKRVRKAIDIMIRNDGRMVQALKRSKGYRCEFPDCGHQIQKKAGGYYVEVAHIEPVARGGKSILGNLLVLCPNHHKEFDYGNLTVTTQSDKKLTGKLNGHAFTFYF